MDNAVARADARLSNIGRNDLLITRLLPIFDLVLIQVCANKAPYTIKHKHNIEHHPKCPSCIGTRNILDWYQHNFQQAKIPDEPRKKTSKRMLLTFWEVVFSIAREIPNINKNPVFNQAKEKEDQRNSNTRDILAGILGAILRFQIEDEGIDSHHIVKAAIKIYRGKCPIPNIL